MQEREVFVLTFSFNLNRVCILLRGWMGDLVEQATRYCCVKGCYISLSSIGDKSIATQARNHIREDEIDLRICFEINEQIAKGDKKELLLIVMFPLRLHYSLL